MTALAILAAASALSCVAPLPTGGEMRFGLDVAPTTARIALENGVRTFNRIPVMEERGQVVAATAISKGRSASIIIERNGRFQFTFNGERGPIFLYGECKR